MLECAECGAEFEPQNRLLVGDVLECPECATELEVVDVKPLTAVVAESDETEHEPGGSPDDSKKFVGLRTMQRLGCFDQ